jgi:hypothetical protein
MPRIKRAGYPARIAGSEKGGSSKTTPRSVWGESSIDRMIMPGYGVQAELRHRAVLDALKHPLGALHVHIHPIHLLSNPFRSKPTHGDHSAERNQLRQHQ